MKNRLLKIFGAFLAIALTSSSLYAREYHVATTGLDRNKGSKTNPFKTISAAALLAQPGDCIIVHEGTYRERINPPRGGTSNKERITYRAARGEEVVIKGSEVITGWQKQTNGIWQVTIPNRFFGDYNPYKEVISGDWFHRRGRDHHTGEVYLNGKALFEEVSLDRVTQRPLSWWCLVDDKETRIWANYADSDPRKELIEINARPAVFYPDKPGRNYITVSGFTLRHAATQWAAPTAEQIALVGTHWSKGWIIENNVISDSKCVGVTLGKDRESGHNHAQSAGGYNEVVKLALEAGWSKDKIGSHIVRNNTIHDCGAAGICGSMGGAFSKITGNHIYNIHINKPFSGAEMAGIKLHAPIDTLIKNNRIHNSDRGIWMDWMTQGTRVSANLCYRNRRQDLFVEVNHGPFIVDNNILLSETALYDQSQGGAYLHNLFSGRIESHPDETRKTPYHKAHSTEIAGLGSISGGDDRFLNNIFTGHGTSIYNRANPPMLVNGNVYLNGAKAFLDEKNFVNKPSFNPNIKLNEEDGMVYLNIRLPEAITDQETHLVTTELLGKARMTKVGFENTDGSPLTIDADYFGTKRNRTNPTAGPFANLEKDGIGLKVWR